MRRAPKSFISTCPCLTNRHFIHLWKMLLLIIGIVVHICAFCGARIYCCALFISLHYYIIKVWHKYTNLPHYCMTHGWFISPCVSVGSLFVFIIIIIHIDFISQSMRHFLRLFSHTNTEKSVNERYTELSLHNNIKAV